MEFHYLLQLRHACLGALLLCSAAAVVPTGTLKSFDARVNVKSRARVRHVTLAAGSSNFPLTKINGGTIATVLWPVVLSRS